VGAVLRVLATATVVLAAATSCNPAQRGAAHDDWFDYHYTWGGFDQLCPMRGLHKRMDVSPPYFLSESQGYNPDCISNGAKVSYIGNDGTEKTTSWNWMDYVDPYDGDPAKPGRLIAAGSSPWAHHGACGPNTCGYYKN
jgi:hypothetical protein